MDMPSVQPAPKRRWLRFALPALFAVAIFCVWLGWTASFVRERKAWYRRVGPARAMLVRSTGDGPNMLRWRALHQSWKPKARPPIAAQEISLVRELMGDDSFDFLTVPASESARLSSLFPEAYIQTVPDDMWKF